MNMCNVLFHPDSISSCTYMEFHFPLYLFAVREIHCGKVYQPNIKGHIVPSLFKGQPGVRNKLNKMSQSPNLLIWWLLIILYNCIWNKEGSCEFRHPLNPPYFFFYFLFERCVKWCCRGFSSRSSSLLSHVENVYVHVLFYRDSLLIFLKKRGRGKLKVETLLIKETSEPCFQREPAFHSWSSSRTQKNSNPLSS